MGKMFFNILATFAEFEVDLLRMRTREGMAVARTRTAHVPGSMSDGHQHPYWTIFTQKEPEV
ncbi:hypothetical protein GCM10027456_82870 [Kineosporia babensis]